MNLQERVKSSVNMIEDFHSLGKQKIDQDLKPSCEAAGYQQFLRHIKQKVK